MENSGVSGKGIIIDEEGDRVCRFLRGILHFCERENYRLFRAGETLPPEAHPAVFLSCRPGNGAVPGGCPVLVTDFDLAGGFSPGSFEQVITYSMEHNGADFTVRNIRETKDGFLAFEIVGIGIIGRVRLSSREKSDARAALAASTAAIGAGIPIADALEALNHLNFNAVRT